MHENLLDVSHVTFLHPGLLDDGNVAGSKTTLDFAGSTIKTSSTMEEVATPQLAFAFSLQPGKRYMRTLVTETTTTPTRRDFQYPCGHGKRRRCAASAHLPAPEFSVKADAAALRCRLRIAEMIQKDGPRAAQDVAE